MSIGGGKSKGGGTTSQSSESQNFGSNVWAPQTPYLQDLYNRAQQASGADMSQLTGNWLGSANANNYQAGNALQQSNAALTKFLSPTVDPAVNAYATNLGQQFREQFLPSLQGEAALAGGLGGSRQQIGAALGAQRAMQTLGDFAAQSYTGQQERALAAAQGIGQNAAGFQQGAQLGLEGADFARSMPWYNLSMYQGLLGSPVMQDLGGWTKSKGTGNNSSSGWNANFGWGS